MGCQKIRENLSLYMDGMLSGEEMKATEEHLLHCLNCGLEYAQMQITIDTLRNLPEISAPPEFRAQVMQRLKEMENLPVGVEGVSAEIDDIAAKATTRFKPMMNWASAAAVLVFAIGITWNLSRDQALQKVSSMPEIRDQVDQGIVDNNQLKQAHRSKQVTVGSNEGNQAGVSSNEGNQAATSRSEEAQDSVGAVTKFIAPNNETRAGSRSQTPNATSSRGAELPLELDDANPTKAAKTKQGEPELKMSNTIEESSKEEGVATSDGESRMVDKVGKLTVRVKNLVSAQSEIMQMVEQAGGYVETASLKSSSGIIVRVPVEAFAQVFKQIQGCGEVIIQDLNGQDITAQYQASLEQVTKLQEQESQLLKLFTKADVGSKTQQLQTELDDVRRQLAISNQELSRLGESAQMSTISIILEEIPNG